MSDSHPEYLPTVCVDLDGVLNLYDGWKGAEHLADPRPGAGEFIRALAVHHRVVVFTTRDAARVEAWLIAHQLGGWVSEVTDIKLPAVAYIDDRAVCFRGDFGDTLDAVRGFKAHWE